MDKNALFVDTSCHISHFPKAILYCFKCCNSIFKYGIRLCWLSCGKTVTWLKLKMTMLLPSDQSFHLLTKYRSMLNCGRLWMQIPKYGDDVSFTLDYFKVKNWSSQVPVTEPLTMGRYLHRQHHWAWPEVRLGNSIFKLQRPELHSSLLWPLVPPPKCLEAESDHRTWTSRQEWTVLCKDWDWM